MQGKSGPKVKAHGLTLNRNQTKIQIQIILLDYFLIGGADGIRLTSLSTLSALNPEFGSSLEGPPGSGLSSTEITSADPSFLGHSEGGSTFPAHLLSAAATDFVFTCGPAGDLGSFISYGSLPKTVTLPVTITT